MPRARARIGKFGGYDPQSQEMQSYKLLAKAQVYEMGLEYPLFDAGEPIGVNMTFVRAMPKLWSKKRKEERLGTSCPTKPDLDNYIKFILDALNEVVYLDDNQICHIEAQKIYGSVPETKVELYSYKKDDYGM